MKRACSEAWEEDEIRFRTEMMGCGVLNDFWLNVARNCGEPEVKSNFGIGLWVLGDERVSPKGYLQHLLFRLF